MAHPTDLLLAALLFLAPLNHAAYASPPSMWSTHELQRILSLGPWPPPMQPDPSNRVSGQPKAIELGRRLFRDARMSPVGYIACVTCHQPDRAFTDNKARAHGLADLPRNTPSLANLRLKRWYGWGGASDSLWMASIRPILDPREFDGGPASVVRLFERDEEVAACYREVFGVSPLNDPARTLVNVGKALAAFQETLATGRTPFDEFRDALQRGDPASAATYPVSAQRGLRLFVGPAGCVACHDGPHFTDGAFHAGAAPPIDAEVTPPPGPDGGDNGRLDDVSRLKSSELNLLGAHNDDPKRADALATRSLVLREAMRSQFRTPSLRNVAVTGPYFHDGRIDQLQDAVRHRWLGQPAPRPLQAKDAEDLAAFLATLTDQHGARRPWTASAVTGCP